MDFADFNKFWDIAVRSRTGNLRNSNLSPWFQDQVSPPIIGFGLPGDGRPIALVTIGLNPSDCEVLGGYVPSGDDPCEHWAAQQEYFTRPYKLWFDRAHLIVQSASGGTASYGGHYGPTANALHLDVSVHPTAGKFDKVFDKEADRDQRKAAIQMLETESGAILFPLIDLLRREHGLANVLVFGFCAPDRGSRTMKTLWAKEAYWEVIDESSRAGMYLARARMAEERCRTLNQPSLRDLNWVLMSQGPSSKSADNVLENASAEIHDRRWFAS